MDQKIPGSKTFSKRIKISESYEDWNGSKFLTCRIGVNLQEKLMMLKYRYMNVFKSATKMGVTMDVALDGFNRCCSGCYDRMGVKTTYTGQEDQEALVDT